MRSDELPDYPLLGGLYYVVPLNSDRVQIANGGRSVVLSGEGLARRLVPLLDALDGRAHLDDLWRAFPDLVPEVLEALSAKGMLTDGAAPSQRASVPPGAALALGVDSSPGEVAEILDSAAVAVVGCGPVGSAIAPLLSKAGVGQLLLCDPEEVSSRDIACSSSLFATRDGQTRAEATRAVCLSDTDTQIETAGRPREEVVDVSCLDLALVETGYEYGDHPSRDADVLLRAGIPFLTYTQDALEAIVGPLVESGGRPCHHCSRARFFSNREDLDEYRAYREHRGSVAPEPDAFLAAHSSIVAGVIATEALSALAGKRCARDESLIIDLRTLTVSRETVLPVAGCAGCADNADFCREVSTESPE